VVGYRDRDPAGCDGRHSSVGVSVIEAEVQLGLELDGAVVAAGGEAIGTGGEVVVHLQAATARAAGRSIWMAPDLYSQLFEVRFGQMDQRFAVSFGGCDQSFVIIYDAA
jgi:hypothetical protein